MHFLEPGRGLHSCGPEGVDQRQFRGVHRGHEDSGAEQFTIALGAGTCPPVVHTAAAAATVQQQGDCGSHTPDPGAGSSQRPKPLAPGEAMHDVELSAPVVASPRESLRGLLFAS